MAVFTQLLIASLLSMFGKLITKAFLERVLSGLVVLGLQKLAAMTTNTVDDDLVRDAAERLNVKTKGGG